VSLEPKEELFIQEAMQFLDHPGFLIRMANTLGKPVELAVGKLPARHQLKIREATEAALRRGLKEVTRTIPKRARTTEGWHTAASFGVGAAGGFFGWMSLPLELPITTLIILRSVAAIAQEAGMDLNDPQTQFECLYILSLGSPRSDQDDALGSAYWTSRVAFAKLAREISSAPALAQFLKSVAARFEVVVGEKLLAEAVPVIGALGGGVINATFTHYFSQAARFHFGLRALENKHGLPAVEVCYKKFKSTNGNWQKQ